MKSFLALGITLALFLSPLSYAELTIVVADIPGFTSQAGNQPFDELIDEFDRSNKDTVIRRLPTARALATIESENNHCLFAGDAAAYKLYSGKPALGSDPVTTTFWRLITSSEQPTINAVDELPGKSIAVIRGTKTDDASLGFSPYGIRFSEVATPEIVLKMVASGRVDVGYISIDSNGTELGAEFHYNENLEPAVVSRGLNCPVDHPQSIDVIEAFNLFLKSSK